MEETLSSREIYSGRILKLRVDDVRLPNGNQTRREIVEHSDAVAIIAIDVDDNVLLVKQFRKPVEKELLEIPAGCTEEGEKVDVTVRREMQEETGYRPQRIERLGGFYSTPGFSTEYLHLYLATDLIPSQLYAEDTESIRTIRVPVSQIPALLSSGNICDAKSIAGLYTFLKYREAH